MLVRAGNDGEWLQLTPVEGFPSGGFRSLCGADAANLLELDAPLPVAAFGPWPAGSLTGVDAVCLTATGDIELLVGTWGEEPRDTLWRLLDVAGALRGTTLETFASHLTELAGERSVTRWLHQRVGGDPAQLEARLREVLDTGDFGFVLVTSTGAGDLAQPLQFVQQGNTRIRVFEVEVLRAGTVEAIEGIEVPLDPAAPAPTPRASRPAPQSQPAPAAVTQAPPTLTVVPDAAPAAEVEPERFETEAVTPVATTHDPVAVEPEPVAYEPVAVEPEPFEPEAMEPEAVEPEAVEEPETFLKEPDAEDMPAAPENPSDVDEFFRAVDRLDHRTSAHLRWLHDALLRLVDEAEYTTDGDRQFLTGWLHGAERLPLYLLDSRGLLQLVIASLPEHEQREYADEVAGMLPETSGSMLLAAGYADVDIPAHLDDQTLLEYLVDNLMEALPGGREAFGTHDPTPEELAEAEAAKADAEAGPETDAEAEADDEVEADAEADVQVEAQTPAAEDNAEPSSDAGSDFFDGVSGGYEPSEVESAVAAGIGGGGPEGAEPDAAQEPEQQPDAEAETTEDPTSEDKADWADRTAAPQKSSGSRWLRRRGAA